MENTQKLYDLAAKHGLGVRFDCYAAPDAAPIEYRLTVNAINKHNFTTGRKSDVCNPLAMFDRLAFELIERMQKAGLQ